MYLKYRVLGGLTQYITFWNMVHCLNNKISFANKMQKKKQETLFA